MVCDVTRQEDVVTFTYRSHVCLSDPYTAGMRPEDTDAVTIVGEPRWNNRLTVVARIATTAMPRYEAIGLA